MFAFLKGKAEIVLEGNSFMPGDTIKGKVILNIKKNFDSKGIVLRLYATSNTTSVSAGKVSNRVVTVYDFRYDLEKQASYSQSQSPLEIPFELKIPTDILSLNKNQQNIVNVVSAVAGRYSQIKWYVSAKVRVRRCLTNITRKIQITVQ